MAPFKIPTVMTADELTDYAFHRAAKVPRPKTRSKVTSERAFAIAKLQSIQDSLGGQFKKYVEKFPSIDQLHPFYRELIDVLIGVDRLKKSLGAMSWAKRKIVGVCSTNIRKIKQEDDRGKINAMRSAAYGRVSSVLQQVNEELLFLNSARQTLRKLPEIDVEQPTVVIAGSPNVGKSMLVKCLSSARPEVAAYPFTTKQVTVGHFEVDRTRYQVIDTPGLLDSDPDARKKIERQAVMSLEHLADLIVFLLDPSEYCGYPLEVQLNLKDQLSKTFNNIPMLVVENKSDLKATDTDRIKVSALNETGIDELRLLILTELQQNDQHNDQ
jgi:nucleolar GTP-binding protein